MRTATRELTVFAEIAPARRAALEVRLREIQDDLEANPHFRPASLPDTHFTRFVIIDDERGELPPMLAWEVNYDGDETAFLERAARVEPSIDHVFEHCVAYPGAAARDAWLRWCRARLHHAAAFYTAYPGVPRAEIVNDIAVHECMRELADRDRAALDRVPGPEIKQRLRDGAAARGLATWPIRDERARWFVRRAAAALLTLAILPLLLLAVGPWYALLRRRERADRATVPARPVHARPALRALEDRILQNQLTHVVDVKPGLFRAFTLRAVLRVVDVLASVVYVHGHLGGITSIHFARWVILRDPRDVPRERRRDRLVFFSNYDGSWESYLGDFIDRESAALSAIWSNTEDFPQTNQLVRDGAKDEEAFKQWTRDHQLETQVWWSGIPTSTVRNVLDDIWLRRRLERNLNDTEMAEWLRRL